MARCIGFSARGRRRFKQGRTSRGKVFLIVLVVVLLFAASRAVYQLKTAAVATTAQPTVAETGRVIALGETIYMRIVSLVIPGFGDITEQPAGETKPPLEQSLEKMAMLDLRDPKLILSTQIPYLVDPSIVPQPLINEPDDTQGAEKPRIIIPVKEVLTGEGKVIVYQTHGTESFVPSSGKAFTPETLDLTTTQLGIELSELLKNQYQVPVVNNTTIHDLPRTGAYEKARPTLEALLLANPDTQLVVDLHRDGVAKEVTTFNYNGQSTARIMFVVGSRHENWEKNNQKAQYLHQALEKIAPGISRGVRERPLVYNQNLHPGSVLIELGGYENSLEEVRRALPILAQALAELYNSGK